MFFGGYEIVVFILEWGILQFGLRAQVAILGTWMIIWFWNLLQDGEIDPSPVWGSDQSFWNESDPD
jgi:hypothetical protein